MCTRVCVRERGEKGERQEGEKVVGETRQTQRNGRQENEDHRDHRKGSPSFPPHLLPIVAWNGMEWGSVRAAVRFIDTMQSEEEKVLIGNGYLLVEMLNDGTGDARQVFQAYLIGGWETEFTTIHGNTADKGMISIFIN